MSTRLSGNLAKLNFSEIINATCMKAKSCQLVVRNAAGEGTIFFAQGEPLHARMGDVEGADAVHRLLASVQKDGGVFTIDFDIHIPDRTITKSWNSIIDSNNNNHHETISNQQLSDIDDHTTENVPSPQTKSDRSNKEKEEIATKSRGQNITKLLKELQRKSPDIQGVAVVSTEGLVIASILQENFEEEHLAAISAIVLSLGERIVSELERGILEQVFVKGEKGFVLVHYCSPEALLAVVTSNYIKLGMIFLDMKRTAEILAQVLQN